MVRRQQVVAKLGSLASDMHRNITGNVEELHVAYMPFGDSPEKWIKKTQAEYEEHMLTQLRLERSIELKRGFTMVGPHRDDLIFSINGQDAKIFASQGQQRTAVLAYKLAEMELMHQETGEYPVVLLDDVMSELDRSRREFLVEILNKKAQTIITTTHLGSFTPDILSDAAIFKIEAGTIV